MKGFSSISVAGIDIMSKHIKVAKGQLKNHTINEKLPNAASRAVKVLITFRKIEQYVMGLL